MARMSGHMCPRRRRGLVGVFNGILLGCLYPPVSGCLAAGTFRATSEWGVPLASPSTSQEPGFLPVVAEMPTFLLLGTLVLYFYHQKTNIPMRLFPKLCSFPFLPNPSRPPFSVSKQNGVQGKEGDPGPRERVRGRPNPSTRHRHGGWEWGEEGGGWG